MRYAVLVALASLPALAAPIPKHVKEERYWPTAVGTKWVYQQAGQEVTREITTAEPLKGAIRLTVRRDEGGASEEVFDVADSGVVWRSCRNFTFDMTLVRFPLKAGDSWPVEIPVQKGMVAEGGKMTVGDTEEITVPAGKFWATRVVFAVTERNGVKLDEPYSNISWYAKGVGLVREEWKTGEWALKSFTPGTR